VYVIHDQKDNPADVLKQVNAACNGPDFDRSELGQYVWTGGKAFYHTHIQYQTSLIEHVLLKIFIKYLL
jgi:hypothetical protein